jgi:biotin carboxyl carrier protein
VVNERATAGEAPSRANERATAGEAASAADASEGAIMSFDFYMPDIGEGVVEGEIVAWRVKEGDRVKLDQPIVEIMTDKATVELPSPRAGSARCW